MDKNTPAPATEASDAAMRVDVYSAGEVTLRNSGRWVREEDHEFAIAQARQSKTALPAKENGDSPSVSVDLWEAYKAWPEDLRKKLSMHDLRRMTGWKPPRENTVHAAVAEQWLNSKATPPAGGFVVEEMPRHPEPVAERVGDMGEGTKLQLFREDDGDFIVSVMPSGHRIPDLQVQFCVPGSGGGKSSKTWDALCALHYAMHQDAHPQIAASPTAQPSAKDGVRESVVRDLQEHIDSYWELAFAEGKEGRTHDTKNGDAMRCRFDIEALIRKLSATTASGLVDAFKRVREVIRGYQDAEYLAMNADGKTGLGEYMDAALAAIGREVME